MSNPIQGFTEGRKDNKESVFGRFIDKFGSSLKDFFVEKVSIEEYTKSLLELIQYTYFIEEWLKCVLKLQQEKQQKFEVFNNNDKISLEYLKSVSSFFHEVVLVIVINDLKYMISFYMIGMQNAMVEEFTLAQQENLN